MELAQNQHKPCHMKHGPVDALMQVLAVTGSKVEDLERQSQGPKRNPVRMLAAWWMTVGAGLPNAEVAKILNMSTAGVCRARRCVRSEHVRKPGSELVRWASILEESA